VEVCIFPSEQPAGRVAAASPVAGSAVPCCASRVTDCTWQVTTARSLAGRTRPS